MIPHPTIPKFYIIEDYFAFQDIFMKPFQPIANQFTDVSKKVSIASQAQLKTLARTECHLLE